VVDSHGVMTGGAKKFRGAAGRFSSTRNRNDAL